MVGKGIGLIQRAPVPGDDPVFIAIVVVGLLHRYAPQPLIVQAGHGVGFGVPAVKIPHHTDRRRMGRPCAEGGFPVQLPVCAQKFPCVRIGALVE